METSNSKCEYNQSHERIMRLDFFWLGMKVITILLSNYADLFCPYSGIYAPLSGKHIRMKT